MKGDTIQIRDERKPGHFWADNELYDIFAADIGIYAFAVYMALCRYANKQAASNPSHDELARKLDISTATVKRAIRVLKAKQLISVQQVYAQVGDRRVYTSNTYTLLDVKTRTDLTEGVGSVRPQVGSTRPKGRVTQDLGVGSDRPINNTQSEQDTLNKEDPPPENLQNLLFAAVADICMLDVSDPTSKGLIGKCASFLNAKGVRPDHLKLFSEWFKTNTWQGEKGDSPSPTDVIKNWRKFAEGYNRTQHQTVKVSNWPKRTSRTPQVEVSTDAERERKEIDARKRVEERAARKAQGVTQ